MVPVAVVHLLKPVQVDAQNAHLRLAARGQRHGLLQAIFEEHAIRKLGERVEVSSAEKLVLHVVVFQGDRSHAARRKQHRPHEVFCFALIGQQQSYDTQKRLVGLDDGYSEDGLVSLRPCCVKAHPGVWGGVAKEQRPAVGRVFG